MDLHKERPELYGGRTYYTLVSKNDSSENEVVVCVHGIGSYHYHFTKLTQVLHEENFTVLNYDLIGRGFSPFPASVLQSDGRSIFNGDGHVQQLRELIVGLQLTLRKYHLIGHSMGGALAALYASLYGDEVLSLTVLSPAGLMDIGALKLLRSCSCLHGIVKNSLRNGGDAVFRQDFHTHTGDALVIENESVEAIMEINRRHPTIFEAFWQSALHFPLDSCAPDIKNLASMHHIRTYILWADFDKAVPLIPSMKRWTDIYASQQHPSVFTKVYKNAGHAFFMEYADEFHTDVLHFLKGNPLSSATSS
jgi:pimeloyl-ACP methyl ester carboxylesterase